MLSTLFPKSKNPALSSKVIQDFCIRMRMEYAQRAILDFKVESSRRFTLLLIIVKERRNGLGTEIIKKITNFCDEYGATCELTPSDSFGTDYSILIEFYEKLGFRQHKYYNFQLFYHKNSENSLFSHFFTA
jgi:GNAT superfamily N-acetyltransferase